MVKLDLLLPRALLGQGHKVISLISMDHLPTQNTLIKNTISIIDKNLKLSQSVQFHCGCICKQLKFFGHF